MEKWIDHEFESSSLTTSEFKAFNMQYKKAMQKALPDFTLENWNRGHFYCSAFWKNNMTGKYIYTSCSDVRFFPNEWFNHILVRTATGVKDYSGGANNYATLENIATIANRLSL